MLDSVTHSTFLPNTSFCDPLMSWTDLFSNEEYYPAFEHQTGMDIWGSPPKGSKTGFRQDVLGSLEMPVLRTEAGGEGQGRGFCLVGEEKTRILTPASSCFCVNCVACLTAMLSKRESPASPKAFSPPFSHSPSPAQPPAHFSIPK